MKINKEPIIVGDGILAQIDKYANTCTIPNTKEELEELLIKACTPTEEEIKAQQELKKRQAENFQYFTQFKKEVIDMLTLTEQAYFYSAMGSCINGSGIVGSKHIEVIKKVEKLSEKYGTSKNWMKDSAYGKAIEAFLKVNDII